MNSNENLIPALCSEGHILAEVQGSVGCLSLNRPQALNALSLPMVRDLSCVLTRWAASDQIQTVLLQGIGRPGKAPAFCAGGDIRFFHQAALAGDPRLEDFFTEEYALNHQIHHFPKPLVVVMDGICMGGGMGLSQGAGIRVVTEHSKLAMPETHIGLFPDVGGGWFLSRCPGRMGEFLALSGQILGAADALAVGLADQMLPASRVTDLVGVLQGLSGTAAVRGAVAALAAPAGAAELAEFREQIDQHFARDNLADILASLSLDPSDWAERTRGILIKRSPLMMAVSLEQVRRARSMSLADDLRMERDMVRHSFHLRPGVASETVEGIRALVVDKDHQPRWSPARVDEVSPAEVAAFFASPWPAAMHPLRDLR